MTAFDFFGKIFIILAFPVNFSHFIEEIAAFFHFLYVFLYFVGIMSMFLNKIEITSLLDRI